MKRLALLLAASATLLVPAAPALAAPAPPSAPAHVDGVSKIPPRFCLAILGSDFERLACSSS
ncbi:MAG TPA: hypothetical protein VHL53_22445 [Acidimicrobiia bacterium]|nr:hypothetical protein [Acidimicrobiia bacterium]